MENKIKEEIIRILTEDNPGILPDELEKEVEKILYKKDTYEQAKWNMFKIN